MKLNGFGGSTCHVTTGSLSLFVSFNLKSRTCHHVLSRIQIILYCIRMHVATYNTINYLIISTTFLYGIAELMIMASYQIFSGQLVAFD